MTQKRTHWSLRKTVDPITGCWFWTGGVNNSGYGKVRNTTVHRVSFEAAKGPIPVGLQIDHLCRNKLCFNPDHLEAVTQSENMLRRPDTRSETHCAKGHAYADVGYYLVGNGRRRCKRCLDLYRPRKTDRRPVDAAAIANMRALRAQGLTVRKIAAITGYGSSTVLRRLSGHTPPPAGPGL